MSIEIQLYKGDIYIENGQVSMVGGEEKLIQQIAKMIMTQKGGFFHPEYGSDIYTLVGRVQSPLILEPLSDDSIRTEMAYYKDIQSTQEIIQTMDDDEVLYRVIKTSLNILSNTAFHLDIDVMNRRGTALNVSSIQGF